MKNLPIILFFTLLLAIVVISLNKNATTNDTRVIITISDLTTQDLFNLNKEFKKYSSMDYIDGSVESGTISIQVNQDKYDQDKVENMLHKWNCKATGFDYDSLLDIAVIE